MTGPKKVLIVDDHPLLRRGLGMLINDEPDLTVAGEAEDTSTALEMIAQLRPDIVLLDISLKNSNGIDLLKQLRAVHPSLYVLVVSMHEESVYAERAIRAGAQGYITKQAAEDNIILAISRVLDGGMYLTESLAEKMLGRVVGKSEAEGTTPVDLLSDREFEVFQLIGRGMRAGQIAGSMNLSVKTIETYQANIKQKLRLRDAWDLNEYAVAWRNAHMEG